MKEIILTNGHTKASVDDEDYEEVNKLRWTTNGHGYAVYCNHSGIALTMHCYVGSLNGLLEKGKSDIHHKNRNGLDNRKENLVFNLSRSVHASTRKRASNNTSGYIGVSLRRGRWKTEITYRGVKYQLGTFDDPEVAAKVRDEKAFELFGELATLNFPRT